MADTVYLYPKTLCSCSDCADTKCKKPSGPRTNMSVRGCELPKCMDCNNRVMLGSRVQPEEKQGWVQLNPRVYSTKYADGFGKIPCEQQGCPKPSYVSWDPRLYSETRYNYIPLDQPPIDGNVRLKDIYERKWNNYGKGMKPYNHINDGHVMYYVDRHIEDAYFKPLFAEKAKEVAVLFKDPMGGVKPEYTRIPQVNTENPTVSMAKKYSGCLSFIQDTQSHREDLLSYQMRKRNQERWETRWSTEAE